MASVLIVEDDEDIRDIMKTYLSIEGFNIFEAGSLTEMRAVMNRITPDILLLDIMLPDGESTDELPFIRSKNRDTGIIVISARGTDRDKIFGFNSGADDYISKPFNPREVVARVRALLKRIRKDEGTLIFDGLEILPDNYCARLNDEIKEMTAKEFEILYLLARQPKKIFTRAEIIDKVWFDDEYITDRVIDVHISAIRSKLGKNWIKTVRNVGYKFNKDGGLLSKVSGSSGEDESQVGEPDEDGFVQE